MEQPLSFHFYLFAILIHRLNPDIKTLEEEPMYLVLV